MTPTDPGHGGENSGGFWRLGLGVADAAVPSVGNLGVSVVMAHSMTLPDFGVFSTVMLSLIMIVGLSRSVHGDVLVLTASRHSDRAVDHIRQSLSSVLLLGSLLALLTAAVGVAVLSWSGGGSPWGPALVASGLVLPILLLQDHHRWIAYTRGAIHDSVLNNSAWFLCSIVAMAIVVLPAQGDVPAAAGVLAWGTAAVAGVVAGTVRNRLLPSLRHGTVWLRENRRFAGALAQDFGLLQASAQGALVLLAALTSATDIGLLRKAQLWLGPVTMVTTGLLSALQSLLARRHEETRPTASTKTAVSVGVVAMVGALIYGSAVFLLPTNWAALLAGDGWPDARSFVWPLTVQFAAGLLGGCVGIALRVRGQVGQQVRARWVLAPASLIIVTLTATFGGALAAAWGLAVVSIVTAGLWCRFAVQPASAPVPTTGSRSSSRTI